MTGAPAVRVRDVAVFIKGKKPSITLDTQSEGALPYVLIEGFGGTYRTYTNDPGCVRCRPDDTIVVADGANTGLASTNHDGYLGSTLGAVRPAPSKVNPRYLFYFVHANFDTLNTRTRGAAIPHLERELLLDLEFSLPPLPEQERIVRILDEAEALRRLRVKADERTASLVSALFQVVVGQPADGHPPIPIGPLSSGLTTVETRRPEATPDEAFDYVDISSVDAASGRIVAPKRMLGAEAPSRARQLVRSGDVLVSTVRPNLRATARVPTQFDGAIASTGFCVLRPHQIIVSEYLEALVRQQWFTEYLVSNATGASYPAVTDAIVKSAEVPIPPVSLQNTFAARVAEIRELEAAQAASRKRLDDLFQSLLHRAFQGQL